MLKGGGADKQKRLRFDRGGADERTTQCRVEHPTEALATPRAPPLSVIILEDHERLLPLVAAN